MFSRYLVHSLRHRFCTLDLDPFHPLVRFLRDNEQKTLFTLFLEILLKAVFRPSNQSQSRLRARCLLQTSLSVTRMHSSCYWTSKFSCHVPSNITNDQTLDFRYFESRPHLFQNMGNAGSATSMTNGTAVAKPMTNVVNTPPRTPARALSTSSGTSQHAVSMPPVPKPRSSGPPAVPSRTATPRIVEVRSSVSWQTLTLTLIP